MILTCPLKTCVIGLHNLISMKIFFTMNIFFIILLIVKRQPKANKLLK